MTIVAAPVPGSRRWVVTIDGACTFLALPKLTAELAEVPAGADVTVEMTVDFLDHASYEFITDWARERESSGGTVEFAELGSACMATALAEPPQRGHFRQVGHRSGHRTAAAHGQPGAVAGFGPVDQLGMVNVAVQLETLYAHPAVRRGVEERGVAVSGLFFDLATARVIEVMVDGIASSTTKGAGSRLSRSEQVLCDASR
ncbi:hypothetical protein [Nocardia abscessus]|uniref:hypothetical protein n=1 Tax=Nocardia abscessus TaxID=120957 RepID=UPI0002FFA570|nr:hypothetical protein [Nocardia abscessus]